MKKPEKSSSGCAESCSSTERAISPSSRWRFTPITSAEGEWMSSTVCWWRREGTKHLVVFANENQSLLINSVLNWGEWQPDDIIFLIHQQSRSLAITRPPQSTSAICGESFRVRNHLKNCCFRSGHVCIGHIHNWKRGEAPSHRPSVHSLSSAGSFHLPFLFLRVHRETFTCHSDGMTVSEQIGLSVSLQGTLSRRRLLIGWSGR